MSNEIEIRNATKELLSQKFEGIIVDEFTGGTMRTRPDLALIGDDFIFVEIKSDCDTLTRLENQIVDYSRYCDQVLIILDEKHKSSYEKKRRSLPSHDIAFYVNSKIEFDPQHRDITNRIGRYKNIRVDISYLLWAEEERQLLYPLGKVPKFKIQEAIWNCYTPKELNKYAREIIVNRWDYLSKQQKRFTQGYQGGILRSQIKHIEYKKLLLEEYIEVNNIRFETTKRKAKSKPLIERLQESKVNQGLFSEGQRDNAKEITQLN
jgi:hypothetical protein